MQGWKQIPIWVRRMMSLTTMATNSLVSPTGKPINLRPVRHNAGLEAAYRKRLTALVDEMNSSLLYWLGAAYKANAPVALDESPAAAMRAAMRKMSRRWQRNFDKGADKLANWFAQKNKDYADVALKGILKDAGFTVEFRMTAPLNDAYQAVIGEQVGLIRSIASQHLTQVEGMVMRSVQQGRDLGTLSNQLQKQFGVTKRRAALIARDQNNKATATITKTRQLELGITQAKWRHSSAGKEPRPSHVHADGELYDIAKGMYLDGVWTWPGVEINCRCTSAPQILGFID
jgi:SPP1 gp7 family putative phage head morphogenesis protein